MFWLLLVVGIVLIVLGAVLPARPPVNRALTIIGIVLVALAILLLVLGALAIAVPYGAGPPG